MKQIFFLIVLLMLASACGIKKNLYLPSEDNNTVVENLDSGE